MAMMDYGAIVVKNGHLVDSPDPYSMKDAVDWEDIGRYEFDRYGDPLHMKGNYFAYIGDVDTTIAFYKGTMAWVVSYEDDGDITIFKESENFYATGYKWYKWIKRIGWHTDNRCTVTKQNGYMVCRWKYKGDKYKVYFGYGVDIDTYKKYHIINYYRSVIHLWNKISYRIKGWRSK